MKKIENIKWMVAQLYILSLGTYIENSRSDNLDCETRKKILKDITLTVDINWFLSEKLGKH